MPMIRTHFESLKDLRDYAESIPNHLWFTGAYSSENGTRHCILGWCGCRRDMSTEEYYLIQENLEEIGVWQYSYVPIIDVNDGNHLGYQQATPKARVLAYLNDLLATHHEITKPIAAYADAN